MIPRGLPRGSSFNKIEFRLFNFPNFMGNKQSSIKCGDNSILIYHMNLLSDEWNIEIKSLCETKYNISTLKEQSGYKLTHIGSIRKYDESDFSGREAENIIEVIEYVLSFAIGYFDISFGIVKM